VKPRQPATKTSLRRVAGGYQKTKPMTAEDQTRQSYKQLDAVLTTLRNNSEKGFNKNRSPDDVIRTTPERAQAIAKIKEALDWLTKDLKALVKPSPGTAPNPNNYCTSSCSSGSSQSLKL